MNNKMLGKATWLFAMIFVASLATDAFAIRRIRTVLQTAPTSDDGIYSVAEASLGAADTDTAKAYDNVTLGQSFILMGINWHGVYAEPIPGAASNVDFLVEIWGNTGAATPGALPGGGAPDVSAPLHSFTLLHGPATSTTGTTGDVTRSVPDDGAHFSPASTTTPGGGPAVQYDAALPETLLPAGIYWVSIQALQDFDEPIIPDPEWQWHLEHARVGDGIYFADLRLNAGAGLQGVFDFPMRSLSFELQGRSAQAPEPSAFLLAALGLYVAFGVYGWRAIRRS